MRVVGRLRVGGAERQDATSGEGRSPPPGCVAGLTASLAGQDDDQYLADLGVGVCNVPVEDWSDAAVAAARACGVAVFSSLINQVTRMSRALDLGVDGVYTDEVATMAALFTARG